MATKKSAGKRPPRPVAKTKSGPKPKPDSFETRYERAQRSRNAARNDMRPLNGPASSSGATRYVREMDNLDRLNSEFSLASKKKKTAEKPLKTGPSAPRRGARYLTKAESKAASKGSKSGFYNNTYPNRQTWGKVDLNQDGSPTMGSRGPTGFGKTADRRNALKLPKSSSSSSAMGGKYPPKKKAPMKGKKY